MLSYYAQVLALAAPQFAKILYLQGFNTAKHRASLVAERADAEIAMLRSDLAAAKAEIASLMAPAPIE